LATEVPSIYAIGECCEHNGRTYGLVAPAWEQAIYARLKVAGIDVASMGSIEPESELDEVIQFVETRRDS
jgi:nitrite reductase (NADH) large subunit